MRGNAISGAWDKIGINQLPNPPIIIGMTTKKIIKNAWDVTKTLYSCSLFKNLLGWANSRRIKSLKQVPTPADQPPKIKYRVPISLWLVDECHRILGWRWGCRIGQSFSGLKIPCLGVRLPIQKYPPPTLNSGGGGVFYNF